MALESFIRRHVPLTWRPFVRSIAYYGNRFVCPCCRGHFRKFLPFGIRPRPNAQCPRCQSLERHRLLWLFLQNETNLFSQNLKVLHVAPEICFHEKLKSLPNLDYLSADLKSPLALMKMDITHIPLPDHSFDAILCNHVLEHIPDDRKALQELFRILKPDGWAIIQVPLDPHRTATFEDKNVVTPQERKNLFGQEDHVRKYGSDFYHRLQQAGFSVQALPYADSLPDELKKKYALMTENINFCTKRF